MKKLFVSILFSIVCLHLSAQNISNPYASIGKKAPKVATVTDGEYEEFFRKDSLVQIGTTVMNRYTGEVAFFEEDNLEKFKQFTEHSEKNFRFLSPDPSASHYPGISPYIYVVNNPINATDPDGKDIYLVVWNTADGEIGHAAIAVDNYKQVQKKVTSANGKVTTQTAWESDGTVSYFDFWPGDASGGAGKSNFDQNIEGEIQFRANVTLSDLQNIDIGIGENRAADGVIKLETDFSFDNPAKSGLLKEYLNQKKSTPQYNGLNNNCSDFAKETFNKVQGFGDVTGKENLKTAGNTLFGIKPINSNSTTPNFLFNEVKSIVTKNPALGKILKQDASKAKNDFINGSPAGSVISDETPGK